MGAFEYHVKMDNFQKDIAELEQKLTNLETVMEEAFVEIAEMVYARLILNIESYGLSRLVSSASVEILSDGFEVKVSDKSAMFIEFGTGIVGANSPHPKPIRGNWIYDTGGHGERGWYYPTTESDPNPWKHYYNGKLYGFTKGVQSRPYMYKTWLYGTQVISPVVNKHIRRALK